MIESVERFVGAEKAIVVSMHDFLIAEGINCVVQQKASSHPTDIEMTNKENTFACNLTLHDESQDSKAQLHLNSIVIPLPLRNKGISMRLIGNILETCSSNNVDFVIVEIVNKRWYYNLLKHGAETILDKDNEWDVYINPEKWL